MVVNIAHRGARSLAPENTMAAVRKAWEVGADALEVDVAVTRDGALILLHDDLLRRTTDVDARFPARRGNPCTTFTLAEIRSLDAGSWFVETDPFGQIAAGNVSDAELASYRGIKVPVLEELLLFVRDVSWRVNLEIKKIPPPRADFPVVPALLQRIDETMVPVDRLIVSSFDHGYLREIGRLRPEIEIQALIGPSAVFPQDWGDYEFQVYNADARCTDEEQIRRAREHGCRVNLYTVNDPAGMRRFIGAGAAGLFTDFPQVLARLTDR